MYSYIYMCIYFHNDLFSDLYELHTRSITLQYRILKKRKEKSLQKRYCVHL
jgi:hypothetical protein